MHLHAQSGGKPRYDADKACFVPGDPVQGEQSAGAANGSLALGACLAEGFAAGAEAAQRAGFSTAFASFTPTVLEPVEAPLVPVWVAPSERGIGRGPKQFVDLQNDVTASDIVLAAREGYRSIEHAKRYTALGLRHRPGQARQHQRYGDPGAGARRRHREHRHHDVSSQLHAGHAGRDCGRGSGGELFDPVRKTALHAWQEEHGALFENVGQWKRPWYFPKPGEDLRAAVARECLATRNSVGIMDASTLGKIDIQGPDAAVLLDWVYTNAWSKLGIGRCRYGLMLDENGMVMDDGVTTRLAEHHYLMTTTTGGAARVMAWLERWLQTEWPHLEVYLTSVTDHWATASVAGPMSRNVVQAVCGGIDFASDAFPFMAYRNGTAAGVPARVMRISFSASSPYEINLNANDARHVWEALMEAGARFDITPYGTEAMHVLRAEKGFIIVGQDTDGSVTPADLGMDWIVAKGKDFLGRRSLLRSDTARGDRRHLVGLLADDPAMILPEGGQIVADAGAQIPAPMLGHVTSSYSSACLGRSIALALVQDGRNRMGEKVHVAMPNRRSLAAAITAPTFLDPDGARQNA